VEMKTGVRSVKWLRKFMYFHVTLGDDKKMAKFAIVLVTKCRRGR
jgi:hypothetical protein